MQCQAMGLPAHGRGVWLEEKAAKELNESLLVGELVELADQRHTQLVLLAANPITFHQQKKISIR